MKTKQSLKTTTKSET